ncbi:hypothetical protein B7463_g3895, partial [Scytalidium lignicola]
MKLLDVLITCLIPTLIIVHLLVAPYTKVEESFNIQATHDVLTYGIPIKDVNAYLRKNYDHIEFPGAVPRTFAGAWLLAQVSRPIILLTDRQYAQTVVRAVLGLFNAFTLLRYASILQQAFGRDVARWYILLQAAQFHVMFYASRTLPNMFAFGLTTLAFRQFLLSGLTSNEGLQARHQKLGIFWFVIAGSIFRSEIAILLFAQLAYLFVQSRISLYNIILAGLISACVGLGISIPVDSYFWQRPIWPELAGFYYNAIQGKSSDWGTSPYHYYLTSLLPRMLLNPMILGLLIPLTFFIHSTKRAALDLIVPSVAFILIYSIQPHKEARFIIYIVPPLTACASLAASYLWTRKAKSLLYEAGSLILVASTLLSLVASTGMLLISSLNYPGGDAISQFHSILFQEKRPLPETISVHMDVLSCMTGITRFQQYPSFSQYLEDLPLIQGKRTLIQYDKNEDEDTLLLPEFWEKFDYVLTEEPERVIGGWEVIGEIYSYKGIEILRPGDRPTSISDSKTAYAVNKLTKVEDDEEVNADSEAVKSVVDEYQIDVEAEGQRDAKQYLEEPFNDVGRAAVYKRFRDTIRSVTGGWWLGPRIEPAIKILRPVKQPVIV